MDTIQVLSEILGKEEASKIAESSLFYRSGLSNVAILRQKQRYGSNELKPEEPESVFSKIKEQFENPLILLLLGSALVSLFLGQYDDAISIAMVIFKMIDTRQITGDKNPLRFSADFAHCFSRQFPLLLLWRLSKNIGRSRRCNR
jgi:hypothetical protein